WKGFGYLAGKPVLRRIWGDLEVNNSSAIEAEYDQGIKKLERRGDDDKHIDPCNVGQVVAQEAPPGRGGDLGSSGHPAPNRSLADFDAELEQFPVDAGRAPQRVVLAHAADQITDLCADLGSPGRRDRQRQRRLKPLRCHWTTVSGLTNTIA